MYARRSAFLALGLILAPLCAAQPPDLRVPSLRDLRSDAIDSVSITVGPLLLWFASRVIGDDDPQSAAVKKLLHGLHKVRVLSYRFRIDHVYREADLKELRSQLAGPGWHHMVQVRNDGTSDDVDVYYALDNSTVTGLAILAAEPREFTLVNIIGTIDLDQVALLRQTFAPGERELSRSAFAEP